MQPASLLSCCGGHLCQSTGESVDELYTNGVRISDMRGFYQLV